MKEEAGPFGPTSSFILPPSSFDSRPIHFLPGHPGRPWRRLPSGRSRAATLGGSLMHNPPTTVLDYERAAGRPDDTGQPGWRWVLLPAAAFVVSRVVLFAVVAVSLRVEPHLQVP